MPPIPAPTPGIPRGRADGNLYSPWTDGNIDWPIEQGWDPSNFQCSSDGRNPSNKGRGLSGTGQARILGDDPLHLTIENLGIQYAAPAPYGGRYPSACLHPQRRLVLRHLLPGRDRPQDARRAQPELGHLGPVRGLSHLAGLRQDLAGDAPYARAVLVRRVREERRQGQVRGAPHRGLRPEYGPFSRRQGLSGRPRRQPARRQPGLDCRRPGLSGPRDAVAVQTINDPAPTSSSAATTPRASPSGRATSARFAR